MENSSAGNSHSLEGQDQTAVPKPHPEVSEAGCAISGFADYLSRVVQQEIEGRKSRGQSVDLPSDEAAISDFQTSTCSSNGCETLDFRPSRPERPTDDSWGDEGPRNPPPKRSTEHYPRFDGPFPWDYL